MSQVTLYPTSTTQCVNHRLPFGRTMIKRHSQWLSHLMGMYLTLMQNKLIMIAHITLLKTVSDIVTGLLTSHSIDKSCKQILYLKILLFHPLTKWDRSLIPSTDHIDDCCSILPDLSLYFKAKRISRFKAHAITVR